MLTVDTRLSRAIFARYGGFAHSTAGGARMLLLQREEAPAIAQTAEALTTIQNCIRQNNLFHIHLNLTFLQRVVEQAASSALEAARRFAPGPGAAGIPSPAPGRTDSRPSMSPPVLEKAFPAAPYGGPSGRSLTPPAPRGGTLGSEHGPLAGAAGTLSSPLPGPEGRPRNLPPLYSQAARAFPAAAAAPNLERFGPDFFIPALPDTERPRQRPGLLSFPERMGRPGGADGVTAPAAGNSPAQGAPGPAPMVPMAPDAGPGVSFSGVPGESFAGQRPFPEAGIFTPRQVRRTRRAPDGPPALPEAGNLTRGAFPGPFAVPAGPRTLPNPEGPAAVSDGGKTAGGTPPVPPAAPAPRTLLNPKGTPAASEGGAPPRAVQIPAAPRPREGAEAPKSGNLPGTLLVPAAAPPPAQTVLGPHPGTPARRTGPVDAAWKGLLPTPARSWGARQGPGTLQPPEAPLLGAANRGLLHREAIHPMAGRVPLSGAAPAQGPSVPAVSRGFPLQAKAPGPAVGRVLPRAAGDSPPPMGFAPASTVLRAGPVAAGTEADGAPDIPTVRTRRMERQTEETAASLAVNAPQTLMQPREEDLSRAVRQAVEQLDVKKLSDRVYRELENRLRSEKLRRGMW